MTFPENIQSIESLHESYINNCKIIGNLKGRSVQEIKEAKQKAAIGVAEKAYEIAKHQIADPKELEKVDGFLHVLEKDVEGEDKVKIQGFRNLIKSTSQVMSNWLAKYKDNYLSHAISANVETILHEGMLKPAEMAFREGGKINFEAGTFEQRVTVQIPALTEDDVDRLRDSLLTDNEKEQLKRLEKELDIPRAKELMKEFTSIAGQYIQAVDEENIREMKANKKKLQDLKDQPILTDYVQYRDLRRKQRGISLKMRDKLDLWQEKKLCIFFAKHLTRLLRSYA